MSQSYLSFVIPCYRSEKTIEMVLDEIISVMSQRPQVGFEVIAVNDCSPDDVYSVLKRRASQDERIKVLSLAKNMGKHCAVLAGHSVARGDYVVDLDDDFQSPVSELWRLLAPLENDECDYVTAKYLVRRQSAVKRLGSNINLLMSAFMLEKPLELRFENFSAMRKFVSEEIIRYKHPFPYLEGLILRVTRRISTVEMEQRSRGDDSGTGFTFRRSVSLWLNGLTAFSVKPLRLATLLGFTVAGFGFAYASYVVLDKLMHPEIQAGFSSVMAVLLITSGVLMCLIGLIGEYVGRIYICINQAPQYIVKEYKNIEKDKKSAEDRS